MKPEHHATGSTGWCGKPGILTIVSPCILPVLPSFLAALRFESPVQAIFRSAISDTTIASAPIAAGEKILIFYGSANRDERKFPNPDVFDVARNPQDHLGFGFGIHYCIGAPLARLEVRIAIDALLQRFPKIRMRHQKLVWVDSFVVRDPSMLPLELH